jgi:catechol 2,3-dioxygenase-like lactoylglutathione lyase family enzyme
VSLRLGSVVINCANLEVMTAFWSAALDFRVGPVSPEGDFRVLAGDLLQLGLQVAEAPVTARDQMHLDLYTREQSEEVSRLLSLGATFVRHHDDPDDDYVVLSDPEGNEFCVCALPAD